MCQLPFYNRNAQKKVTLCYLVFSIVPRTCVFSQCLLNVVDFLNNLTKNLNSCVAMLLPNVLNILACVTVISTLIFSSLGDRKLSEMETMDLTSLSPLWHCIIYFINVI